MSIRQFKTTQSITERNSLSMEKYLRDVSHRQVVSQEEEVKLARAIRRGGAEGELAKQQLIEANLRFVITVAKQYSQTNMELADIISEGNIGLIKAAERFDETRGIKFISYAVWWIRQAIQQAVSEQGQTVRMPQHIVTLQNIYSQLFNKTMQAEQRRPTAEEFADYAGIDSKQAEMLINNRQKFTSMSTPAYGDSDTTVGDNIGDEAGDETERMSLSDDIREVFRLLLNEKETIVLCSTFGLNRNEETFYTLAVKMGLTKERVRQIREKAISKIRRSPYKNLLRQYLG